MDNDPQTEGEVHSVGPWYAVHETPALRPHEGATLRVWRKHGVGPIHIIRGNATQNATNDEIDALIALLQECKEID